MRFAILAVGAAAACVANQSPAAADGEWSSLHAGVHLGYGGGQDRVTEINGPRAYYVDSDGLLGGLQFGASWQWGRFVAGVELEAGHLGQTAQETHRDATGAITVDTTIGPYGALTGKLGYAIAPNWLILARGGLAVAAIDASTTQSCNGGVACNFTPSIARDDSVAPGIAIGGGVEFAVLKQWTVRAEYQYMRFSERLALPVGPGEGWNHDPDLHALKFSLNFRF